MMWPEYPLSQLVHRFISGGTPSTEMQEYWDGDIPWITGADFADGQVILGRRYINRDALHNSATNIVPRGSILLVTRTGVGKVAIAPQDIAISQDITGIILKQIIDPRFVLAAIKSKMGIILAAQRGATIKGVTRKEVASLPIPLPTLAEQRLIVEILDQADALRKKRAEADAKAERIIPALFYKMFGDPVANTMGWPEASIDTYCDIVTGNTPNTKVTQYFGGNIPWARPADLDSQILVTKTEKTLSDEAKKVARIVPANSVLVVCIGATLGKLAIAGVEMAINQQINAILPCERLLPEFLYIQCHFLAGRFMASATKSTLPILNKSRFGSHKLIYPPKHNQIAFANAARIFIRSHEERKTSRDRLEMLFGTILHRVFTGDLTAKWRETHMEELLAEMEEQVKLLGKFSP